MKAVGRRGKDPLLVLAFKDPFDHLYLGSSLMPRVGYSRSVRSNQGRLMLTLRTLNEMVRSLFLEVADDEP